MRELFYEVTGMQFVEALDLILNLLRNLLEEVLFLSDAPIDSLIEKLILNLQKAEVKSESIFKEGNKEILKITSNGNTIFVTKKAVFIDINKIKYIDTNDKDFINSLSKNLKDELKSTKTMKFGLVQRTYFGFSDSLEEANKVADNINEAANQAITTGEVQAQGSFWHASYIEDYSSWAGHGYHIHLSTTDTSYITNMGWIAADTAAATLAALEIVTGPVAVILGAIATASVITLAWKESNSDGSIDIWSPDIFRGVPVLILTPGLILGTVKIGSNWYPLVY